MGHRAHCDRVQPAARCSSQAQSDQGAGGTTHVLHAKRLHSNKPASCPSRSITSLWTVICWQRPTARLLNTAIQNRSTGYTLSHSAKFRDQLPRDAYANFSGIIYHDMGTAINSLVDKLEVGECARLPRKRIDSRSAGEQRARIDLRVWRARPHRCSANGSLFGFNLNTLALPAVHPACIASCIQTTH